MQFSHPGQRCDRLNIRIVQRMTSVKTHPRLDDGLAGPSHLGEPRRHFGFFGGSTMLVKGMRIWARMDLADGEPALGGRGDLTEVRIDER